MKPIPSKNAASPPTLLVCSILIQSALVAALALMTAALYIAHNW